MPDFSSRQEHCFAGERRRRSPICARLVGLVSLVFFVLVLDGASQLALAQVHEDSQPALALAESRLSYGLALGGGVGKETMRGTPVGLELLAESAIIEDPWTSLYGGVLLESFGQNSVGAVFGVRLRPRDSTIRLSAGVVGVAVPTTLGGVSVMLGTCQPLGSMFVCIDGEAVAFAFGKDLPEGRVATQLKIGVAFAVAVW